MDRDLYSFLTASTSIYNTVSFLGQYFDWLSSHWLKTYFEISGVVWIVEHFWIFWMRSPCPGPQLYSISSQADSMEFERLPSCGGDRSAERKSLSPCSSSASYLLYYARLNSDDKLFS
jgi:hypothetical protein